MDTLGWLMVVTAERDAAEALARIHDVARAPFATARRHAPVAAAPDADAWKFGECDMAQEAAPAAGDGTFDEALAA